MCYGPDSDTVPALDSDGHCQAPAGRCPASLTVCVTLHNTLKGVSKMQPEISMAEFRLKNLKC